MGLFNFVKGMGRKLFNNEADAAEKITEHIQEDNPGVDGMKVDFKDGVVTITGDAATPEAKEKAVLMAGNVKGVTEVKADTLNAPEQEAKVEYHTIESGDNLWKIAEKYYGKGNLYTKIFEENREVIKDPDKIFPGQKIRIPLESDVETA